MLLHCLLPVCLKVRYPLVVNVSLSICCPSCGHSKECTALHSQRLIKYQIASASVQHNLFGLAC